MNGNSHNTSRHFLIACRIYKAEQNIEPESQREPCSRLSWAENSWNIYYSFCPRLTWNRHSWPYSWPHSTAFISSKKYVRMTSLWFSSAIKIYTCHMIQERQKAGFDWHNFSSNSTGYVVLFFSFIINLICLLQGKLTDPRMLEWKKRVRIHIHLDLHNLRKTHLKTHLWESRMPYCNLVRYFKPDPVLHNYNPSI